MSARQSILGQMIREWGKASRQSRQERERREREERRRAEREAAAASRTLAAAAERRNREHAQEAKRRATAARKEEAEVQRAELRRARQQEAEVARILRESQRRQDQRSREALVEERRHEADRRKVLAAAARKAAADQAAAAKLARRRAAEDADDALQAWWARLDTVLTGRAPADAGKLSGAAAPSDPQEIEALLAASVDRDAAFPHLRGAHVSYEPSTGEVLLTAQLPLPSAVPEDRRISFSPSRGQSPVKAPVKDRRSAYNRLVASCVLRHLAAVFESSASDVVKTVAYRGDVDTHDPATGRAETRCLVSVVVTRSTFEAIELDLPTLDPARCLRDHLTASVSSDPYEVVGIRPFATYDLTRFKILHEVPELADLDGRVDILQLTPRDFEKYVKRLFEHKGLTSWETQESRDDGVDAVAVNPDSVLGGVVVVQAKRYRKAVERSALDALMGVMGRMKASRGILVTTSWMSKAAHQIVADDQRLQIIEGPELVRMIQDVLGEDPYLSLPEAPARWQAEMQASLSRDPSVRGEAIVRGPNGDIVVPLK